jgi:hypothetical protein
MAHRVLRNLRIDEVSCVIKGSSPGASVLIRKSDDAHRERLRRTFAKLSAPPDDDFDDDIEDIDEEDDEGTLPAGLEQSIAAIVAASPSITKEQAALWLIHTPRGRAAHAALSKRKDTPVNRTEELTAYVKQSGSMVSLAKHIVTKGTTANSEHEFSACLMEHARLNKRDNESDAQAFSRILQSDAEIRRAYGIVKKYPNTMRTKPVSTEVGDTDTDGEDEAKEAARQLSELADEQRRRSPTLSKSKAFEKVYADPANRALIAKAHRRVAWLGSVPRVDGRVIECSPGARPAAAWCASKQQRQSGHTLLPAPSAGVGARQIPRCGRLPSPTASGFSNERKTCNDYFIQ